MAKENPKFTKEQLLSAKAFAGQRDILNALLEEGKLYTADEVAQMVTDFLSREVE
ncbi:hypothetical protein [Heliophilum fasciatum]|uniref:Uncharacterized protein n=1 Tax=Heliophilum fasciatum TaxID=35700 RepID=A0A4R2RXQ5_9FIRM|nr:hypothetical protein [Heliophilum fasciatum]MCW2277734.1 hypothetical protein [Heliophilum fasciatum]TCP64771.1 hypothetical protein EDD73_108124 [Heliophilum fasciatum]